MRPTLCRYTSGSTKTPRGVSLTHGNLYHNSASICRTFQLTPQDVVVLWLPMYHNLGLVGGLLQPLFAGMTGVLMSPQVFLQNPLLWLKAITRYKGTVCGAPNFGFDLCVHRIPPEQRAGLDLSSWNLAFNGAEAVRADTIERFCAAFGPYGFKRSAFYPCYGLAEATLMVTGGTRSAGPLIVRADKAALEANQARLFSPEQPGGQPLISNGRTFSDQELIIVDPASRIRQPDDRVGEIWLRGPSVSPGYWNRPEETAETFQGYLAESGAGPYLRTGDLGFLHDQELFITGRLKELIIIRGRNLYPVDVERIALESHPALVPNGGAAFSVEVDGEEKLVLVQEIAAKYIAELQSTSQAQPAAYEEIAARMRQAVSQSLGIPLYGIALVAQGSIGKTISGKIQRQLTRTQYLSGNLQSLFASKIEAQPAPQSTANAAATAEQPGIDNLLLAALMALGPQMSGDLLEGYLRTRIGQILKIAPAAIDARQPLTAYGMDSITSIELVGYIKDTFGVDVPMDESLQNASLSDLTGLVVRKLFKLDAAPVEPAVEKSQPAQAPSPAQPEPVQAAAAVAVEQMVAESPLTYGQRALWFMQQIHPEDLAHNIVYAITMHTELDTEVYRRGIQSVVERHPMLRARFTQVDGQPIQRIYTGGNYFTFAVEDATTWTPEQLQQRLEVEVYQPFDLETGPLMRLLLLKQAAGVYHVVLSMHHILTDLWSTAMLAYEFAESYTAEIEHRPAKVRPEKMSFIDCVKAEKQMLSGPEGEKLLAYWKERLSGDLPALNLPADHPRPAQPSARAASQTMHLKPELVAALKALAAARDATLFSTLLSAFYTLLYRYTGQTDLLVGTPKAGRGLNSATTVGYFINPVILRARLDGAVRFADLLAQVKENVQNDFQHDSMPFPLLVETLQPSRNLGTNPLLQVFFSWQKTHRMADSQLVTALALNEVNEPVMVGGYPTSALPIKARVSPTDLALLFAETADGGLGLTIEYSTDLFEAQTVERLFGHLDTLLWAVTADPEQPIGRLPMLTEAERSRLLTVWNTPIPPAEGDPSLLFLHTLVEQQAARTPDAVAIEATGETLTYAELVRKARWLAQKLVEGGAGPGTVTGMFAGRSPEMIVGLLAILQSGSAYLPLDPDYPAERLAYMLSDSGATAVLTQSALLDRLPGSAVRAICLDVELAQAAALAVDDLPVRPAAIQPDAPAYMMYTSGSTGQPKGVLISHRAIARHCAAMREYYQITAQDRVLQFSSLNFDPSLEQIFTALLAGARLVLRDRELWDPAEFSRKIADLQLSVVNVPPAYWSHWAAADARAEAPLSNPQLRLVIVGGDVMLPEDLRLWQQTSYTAVRLINAYGPTEAVITAAAYEVPAEAVQFGASLPIGRPTPGRTAYILDDRMQPVPAGIPGELYIGGECLALGYHNQSELTQEKFIADPFSAEPGARLYRTGDLARVREQSGQPSIIEFLGRADRQIKVLGIRIEPGEIEAALKQHPSVADAVVVYNPRQSSPLTACLVTHSDSAPRAGELSAFLAHRLPPFMVPADFVVLDALPLTSSGKIDRDALLKIVEQQRTQASASRQDDYAPPTNAVEEYLACLWAVLLHVERVGIHDNYFALGGHSLLATQIMSRVREQYHVDIPLRSLFETPTVANLALAITNSLIEQENDEDLDALLAEIEGLPDEGN